MKIGLFPGSFDPPTMGHLDIIERALVGCDKLLVAVGHNTNKPDGVWTPEERVALLNNMCTGFPQVEVLAFSGLIVDFAKEVNASFLVRGLRAFSDFEYEFKMALANRKMSGIETLFLMADSRHAHISSSLIREIGQFGHNLQEFVPTAIHDEVIDRLRSLNE